MAGHHLRKLASAGMNQTGLPTEHCNMFIQFTFILKKGWVLGRQPWKRGVERWWHPTSAGVGGCLILTNPCNLLSWISVQEPLGKEPSSYTSRFSLDRAEEGTHPQRVQTAACLAQQPGGSWECPETSHSRFHTTQAAPGSGGSLCSSHKISAPCAAQLSGSAPRGSVRNWRRTSSSQNLSHQ